MISKRCSKFKRDGETKIYLSGYAWLVPDRTRRHTAKRLFKRRTLWLKELSSPIMHGKCVRLVLLKTYWQADWLSQKFFKVCFKTNNTDSKCYAIYVTTMWWPVVSRTFVIIKLSHIVIPLVALCNKQAVAICNNNNNNTLFTFPLQGLSNLLNN